MRPHLERTPTRHTNRCATPQTAPEWRCLSAVQPHAHFRVFAYVSARLVGDVAFRPRKIDFFASFWFSFFFGKKWFFFYFFLFFQFGCENFQKKCRENLFLTLSSSADSQLFKNMLISKFWETRVSARARKWKLVKIWEFPAQCVENAPGFTHRLEMSAGKSESCSRKSNTEGRVHRR